MKKIVLIGRHELTPPQIKILKDFFGEYTIERIEQVDVGSREQVEKMNSVDAVVVQALPIEIMAKLLKVVKTPIYSFKIKAIGVVPVGEAGKVAEKVGADIINVDARTGNARVSKTVGLQRILRIEIVCEDVINLG